MNKTMREQLKNVVPKEVFDSNDNDEQIADIIDRFTYHPPKNDQNVRYNLLREHAKKLAFRIADSTPRSAEQTKAIRYLEEAVMWANKAIAIHE